jgi:biotin synthase
MTKLSQPEILQWLRENRPAALQDLFTWANDVRRKHVGDAVHLRGLIEISSYCERQCMYCGLRKGNRELARYRMTRKEIEGCVRLAEKLGYGTVVMQAGEDDGLSAEWIADIVQWIKRTTPLALTLSLGERDDSELRMWREAGADRYLLRFETSDRQLFRVIHPARDADAPNRLTLLRRLRRMGYECGGGVMVGIPGQSYASLAQDVAMFRELDLDMIGIGPWIEHIATPLGSGLLRPRIDAWEQVQNDEQMVYKMIALTRIACPTANIPSTTALATLNKQHGRRQGLAVGANVVMPNLTPMKYRALYEIYPAKACIEESATDCNGCLRAQIRAMGRVAGSGPGGRGDALKGPMPVAPSDAELVQLQV